MRREAPGSPTAFTSPPSYPYSASASQFQHFSSSIASLASASSTSVSSTTSSSSSSQSSDDGSTSSSISVPCSSDSDGPDSYGYGCAQPEPPRLQANEACKLTSWWASQQQAPRRLHVDIPVPQEQRQHPRRSSSCSTTRSGCPPSLVRQADRKVNFVDNLVDSATQIVEAIWPTSSVVCRNETSNSVLPLRSFIQETLRRSRTSYSTLQVALYYLILVKPHVPEHDFTMEQPEDCHATRALQCGRRMFLAALILASKYLQDRNYSARAWSKISGLATQEINQNEMAFLLAVNWNLHVTNEIYNRWTDCVIKFTPSQPPSPGGAGQRLFERQCEEFRYLVLKLSPGLENIEDLTGPWSPSKTPTHLRHQHDFAVSSPRSLFSSLSPPPSDVAEGATTPSKAFGMGKPMVMEPAPATVYTPGRMAPALGLLPTPRLTPQSSGFGISTPAVSAVPQLLSRGSAMSFVMAQASSATATHCLDRWSAAVTSSPQSYFAATRRSSLATSVSTASSPESMISDSSRTSRSSSISSASSLASAPSASLKLDVQARCRSAKLCSERFSLMPTIIASVPEDHEENQAYAVTSPPETYTGPVGKQVCDMDDNDAARALQELHNYPRSRTPSSAPARVERPGSKRSRPLSMENGLQDNVRDLLKNQVTWPASLVRSGHGRGLEPQVPERVEVSLRNSYKRVCCATEAQQPYSISSLHPAVGGMGGPGMWTGILN